MSHCLHINKILKPSYAYSVGNFLHSTVPFSGQLNALQICYGNPQGLKAAAFISIQVIQVSVTQ